LISPENIILLVKNASAREKAHRLRRFCRDTRYLYHILRYKGVTNSGKNQKIDTQNKKAFS
jgi:hypothetical protein